MNRDEATRQLENLIDAAEEWVKAEFTYRLGPNPYTTRKQTRLIEAEENLRKALTGKKYLRNAAKKLGVDVDTPPFKPLPVPSGASKPGKGTVTPPKQQKRPQKGLFDV
jgi:hypothetical protein